MYLLVNLSFGIKLVLLESVRIISTVPRAPFKVMSMAL